MAQREGDVEMLTTNMDTAVIDNLAPDICKEKLNLLKRPRSDDSDSVPTDAAFASAQCLDEHAYAKNEAGFSLSAIDKIKTRDDAPCDQNDDSNGENGMHQNTATNDVPIDDDDKLDKIKNMLDELPDDFKVPNKPKYVEKQMIVLDEKRQNHLELLPEGWVRVTHNSGMPMYLHKQSRVCCASQPYFLGAGSVRKHAVPVGAIPCLNYRRAMQEEEDAERSKALWTNANAMAVVVPSGKSEDALVESGGNQSSQVTSSTDDNGGDAIAFKSLMPPAKIISVKNNIQKESLTPDELNVYCKKLFKFKVFRVLRVRNEDR